MKRLLSESELLRLADLNMLEYWCESSRWMPGTEVVQQHDMVFINSAVDFPVCNSAFNMAVETDGYPEAFVARAKAFFSERKQLFSIRLRSHCDQAIIQHCKDNKILLVAEGPGMVLDKPIKRRAVPPGAELRWVEDENGVRDFKNVVAEAFGDLSLPLEVSEAYFAQAQRVLSPYSILAVAYLKGKPAGAAMAMLSHGIGGIYWVGTTKKARGMGLGEYCTRVVGNAAFDMGARKVILQASKFGEPVYLKMGYREVTRYPWFICSSK